MWEPRPATCGPCGSPSVIRYKRKGRYVEQTNACPACGWAYGGLVHVLGNLVRWEDGAPEADEYEVETIRNWCRRDPPPGTQLTFLTD